MKVIKMNSELINLKNELDNILIGSSLVLNNGDILKISENGEIVKLINKIHNLEIQIITEEQRLKNKKDNKRRQLIFNF